MHGGTGMVGLEALSRSILVVRKHKTHVGKLWVGVILQSETLRVCVCVCCSCMYMYGV